MTSNADLAKTIAKAMGITEEELKQRLLAMTMSEDTPAKEDTPAEPKAKTKPFTIAAFRAMKAQGKFPQRMSRTQAIARGLVPTGYHVPKSATPEAKAAREAWKAEHPEAVTTEKPAKKSGKSAKKAAVAAQRPRDAKGQFLPGAITETPGAAITPDLAAKVLALVEAGFTKDEAISLARQATKA